MQDLMVSRRRLFGLAGVSAGAGLLAMLPAPARAWFGPKDLSREIAAFRWARALGKHPEAQMGSPAVGKPPGRLLAFATREGIRCSEALFRSQAKCAGDVHAKYALLEEYGYRWYWLLKRRQKDGIAERVYGPWMAQLDADMERFGVDLNPWWRDDCPSDAMVNGRRVVWRDGGLNLPLQVSLPGRGPLPV